MARDLSVLEKRHSTVEREEFFSNLQEMIPQNYKRLTVRRKRAIVDKDLEDKYKKIVYIRRRNLIRQVLSLAVPFKN